LLVGALGIGLAVAKSGLLKRLSLYVIKLFPATFTAQVLDMITSGVIIAPLIPSTTAKAVIATPISMGISDAMGYERKSKGAGGLFGAFYIGFVSTGPLFLSASFIGYLVLKFLPPQIQAQFNWIYWFVPASPWGLFCTLADTKGRYALVTMCIGGGMSAAGIIEML